jgi:hypothetical protein
MRRGMSSGAEPVYDVSSAPSGVDTTQQLSLNEWQAPATISLGAGRGRAKPFDQSLEVHVVESRWSSSAGTDSLDRMSAWRWSRWWAPMISSCSLLLVCVHMLPLSLA